MNRRAPQQRASPAVQAVSSTRPITFALIRQRYAADGGAERFVGRLLEAMGSGEIEVTLIAREWPAARGVEFIEVDPFFVGRVWRDWSFARSVCRLLKQRQFSLVQSHERLGCCDIYRAGDGVHREWLTQRARVLGALACIVQTVSPYHCYLRRAERRLFTSSRLKAVICNSNMVREEIRRHFGVAEDKLHVIYSGVDTGAFHPRLRRHRAEIRERYGVSTDATLYLFVGSGFERKGVAILLEAIAALPPDVHLIVVGRDRRAKRYRRLAQSLGLGTRVQFVGSQLDVKPFYGAADALVLPTLYDPFPNVALEAMASGLAVVTSSKSGAAELIRDGVNGYVRDALDVYGISAVLDQLRDAKRRAAMGAAARLTAERFDIADATSSLFTLYRRLAGVTQRQRLNDGNNA